MTITVSDLNDREKFVWDYIRQSPYASKVSEEEYLSAIERIHSGTNYHYPLHVADKVMFLAQDTIAVSCENHWSPQDDILHLITAGLDIIDVARIERLYHEAADKYSLITIPTPHHIYCIDHGKLAASFAQ